MDDVAFPRGDFMGPGVTRPVLHDDKGTGLKNDAQPFPARYLPKDHFAGGEQAERDDCVAEAGLAVDMRADPLPRSVLVRNHLIRQIIEMPIRNQTTPQGLQARRWMQKALQPSLAATGDQSRYPTNGGGKTHLASTA